MVEAAVLGVFFKVAIDSAAVVADGHGFQNLVKDEVDDGRNDQREAVSVVAKGNPDCENKYAKPRVEVLLDVKFVASTENASVDLAALLHAGGQFDGVLPSAMGALATLDAIRQVEHYIFVAGFTNKFNRHILSSIILSAAKPPIISHGITRIKHRYKQS